VLNAKYKEPTLKKAIKEQWKTAGRETQEYITWRQII